MPCRERGDVESWTTTVANAFRPLRNAAKHIGWRKKVKPVTFREQNGKTPFNASGVVSVAPGQFVFVDNNDSSALFELSLDADGAQVTQIRRRPLSGIEPQSVGDLESLTRVDVDDDIYLIAASSLCATKTGVNDGLLRIRYTSDGVLPTEAMHGFRASLLEIVPSLRISGGREPDSEGLNIEGLTWDPAAGALLFGLRSPGVPGQISIIRVPLDAGTAPWVTSSLAASSTVRLRVPGSKAAQGIRDICRDEQSGDFLILLGRSTSGGDAPFQLCLWGGGDEDVRLLDVAFHRSMKPEGITIFGAVADRKVLIVDDRGGYAVLDYTHTVQVADQ